MAQADGGAAAGPDGRAPYGRGFSAYVLSVLTLILVFNTFDRIALGLGVQQIKADLALSDGQLGVLTGIAFALFYATMGVPISRWADRGDRVGIVALTTALWSLAVGLTAVCFSFIQLLLCRISAAVGEAGCMPTANSLIADYYTAAERPRALARYLLGGPISSLVGFFAAGWLIELLGWRAAFVALGAPGLALALLVRLTFKEPRRTHAAPGPAAPPAPAPGLRATLALLWRTRTFRLLLLAYSITCFFGYGEAQWQPAYFIRAFGMSTGALGVWLTVTSGLTSVAGMYAGGELASRFARDREGLQLAVMAVSYVAAGAAQVGAYLVPRPWEAFLLLAVTSFLSPMGTGPMFAILARLTRPDMRAQSMAVLFFIGNLVGLGLGPLAIGLMSDASHAQAPGGTLRFALIVFCAGWFWGAWHFWQASRTVMADLDAERS